MSSATLSSPPIATARLVVDTDVASFVFKWHPEYAPRYVAIMRGSELVVSFMTLAEMRQGALEASWGRRKCDALEAYLADFSVLHSDSLLCSTWATERSETFPYVFTKPPSTTLIASNKPVVIPKISPDNVDWELELCIVMGNVVQWSKARRGA